MQNKATLLWWNVAFQVVKQPLLSFTPECRHVLERLALGFGHEAVYEPGRYNAYGAVKSVGEHMAEFSAHRAEAHVVHRHKGARYDEIEYPLERYGHRDGCRADGIRENLGYQHPAYRAP